MATYNGAKYIQEQLQSFEDQTKKPDELIITDDCSNDNTESIIREFSKKASFDVKFYRNNKRLGYCGNFNSALMLTSGDLVFLSDQDDVWFPDKIEHMTSVAEKNPQALLFMNDTALTDAELNNVGLTIIGQMNSAGLSMKSFVMGCCCVVRRKMLDFCLPIPPGVKGHDNWLAWFAEELNAKIVVSNVLQYYRRHESNESRFIANRTKKVTRTQAFLHSMKNALRRDASESLISQIKQIQILILGINRAKEIAPPEYTTQLFEVEQIYLLKIKQIENRLMVVKKSFFPRIIAVGILYIRGQYGFKKNIRPILTDILG